MTAAKNLGAGEPMFVFKELEGRDGEPPHTIGFTDVDVQPLGYDELANARLHEKLTIPLNWDKSKVVHTTIAGMDQSKRYKVATTLESPFTSQAIGLVKGGWLPSAFAVMRQNTTVLVDRNVVTRINGRFDNGENRGAEPDFLDLFADQPIRINPLLFVMEGNDREIPTPEQAASQLMEVEAKLRAALPQAQIVGGPDHFRGALGLLEDSRKSFEARTSFLLDIGPRLAAPVGRARMSATWADIVATADTHGIPRNSLVLLATLSAIAVPNGRSPARRLLNFKRNYGRGDAYNALADLRALDILISLFCLFPNDPVQLCTSDKDLALLWTGIQASDFRMEGRSYVFDMAPVEALLPGDTYSAWRRVLSTEAGIAMS